MPFDALSNPDQHTIAPTDLRLLRLAADLLRRGKWCQGALGLEGGAHCALGWLVEAYKVAEHTDYDGAAPMIPRRVASVVDRGFGWSPRALAEFNDAPRTKKRHVVELFDKAVWRLEHA